MSILSWNCRGLGNPRTIRDLFRLVKEMHPDLICLMETKLQSARFECLKLKLGFDCVLVVDSRGKSGGLALFWKADFQVNIQNFSCWHINGTVLFYRP
jgi:exonuclease III